MAQTASMRATSLAASAGLLGAFVMVALTFTYELRLPEFPPDLTQVIDVVEPPPPPTVPPERQQSIRQPLADPVETIDSISTANDLSDVELAPAQPSYGPPGPPTVTSPHWLRRPTSLQRYYPRRALETGLEGDVVLDCLVTTGGFLRCGVISETPVGRGFAEAALRIAADHQMQPAMRNGVAVEGRYRMRVPFRVD